MKVARRHNDHLVLESGMAPTFSLEIQLYFGPGLRASFVCCLDPDGGTGFFPPSDSDLQTLKAIEMNFVALVQRWFSTVVLNLSTSVMASGASALMSMKWTLGNAHRQQNSVVRVRTCSSPPGHGKSGSSTSVVPTDFMTDSEPCTVMSVQEETDSIRFHPIPKGFNVEAFFQSART